ncbi:MAG: glycosyl hydrolase, partial [Gemmatimonadota bacterium]
PDLTLDLESHQQSSGGVAIDNLMTFDGSLVFSIAESPLERGAIWVGTNDGQVQLTRDGGGTWTNVTANIPGLPEWGTVSNVEPSRHDAATAYISVDLHQMADFGPWIYQTRDWGGSWRKISDGIPSSPHSFVHVVKEDPKRPGMLFAGTDNSVWMTLDDGDHWTKLRLDMPPAPVYWLVVQERFDDLVVATYGRGFWILDDIGPLRALDGETLASDGLFQPSPAFRWQEVQGIKTEPSMSIGRDPRYGANIDYFVVGEQAPADTGRAARARITLTDAEGTVVRELTGPARPGINRAYWDLRHPSPELPRFRTNPPGRDWVALEQGRDREVYVWDIDLVRGHRGPLAVPGTYTVRVEIGDESFSAPLEVLKDPHSTGTLADIEEQVAFSLELRDRITEVTGLIERMEHTRLQLRAAEGALAAVERDGDAGGALEGVSSDADTLLAEVRRARERVIELEGRLVDVNLTGAREDSFRNPMRLYGRFSALASDVDWKGSDFPPTAQQREVADVLTGRLDEARRAIRDFLETELNVLNERLLAAGMPPVVME